MLPIGATSPGPIIMAKWKVGWWQTSRLLPVFPLYPVVISFFIWIVTAQMEIF